MASFDEDNLVAFYCLSASEIWPYKRGDLSLRDNLVAVEIRSDKRDGLWWEWPCMRGVTKLLIIIFFKRYIRQPTL
jgi:hypothetical protein